MGCQRCRGWEESECCLSQSAGCTCGCHAECDCAFCHAVDLKARSSPSAVAVCTLRRKSTTSRITTALRREPRPEARQSLAGDESPGARPSSESRSSSDNHKSLRALRWSRRGSALKPMRLFA
ncbi:hypothetical protein H4R19_002965 [Coemansia spiralis]|nr:hypothetical protein H4R19_002965 [Coemansia spiralis]